MIQELVTILSEVEEYEESHHLGRPFLSAYQLAIAFSERYPTHHLVTSLPLGGLGTNEPQSLTQQIARTLSSALRNQQLPSVEGGFISHKFIDEMRFRGNVSVSTLKTKPGHSIFRYIG